MHRMRSSLLKKKCNRKVDRQIHWYLGIFFLFVSLDKINLNYRSHVHTTLFKNNLFNLVFIYILTILILSIELDLGMNKLFL